MEVIDLSQNSEEWLIFRQGKIGASDCATILGKNPWKTPFQLWEEKNEGKQQFVSAAMKRGTEMEPLARKKIEHEMGLKFPPLCVLSEKRNWQMASLDGINIKAELSLEIKCPGEKTFQKFIDGEVPEMYEWQVQHQLAVTGYELGLLFVFNGEIGVKVWIERDESKIDQLNEAEKEFWISSMCLGISPPPAPSDYIERPDMEDLLHKMRTAKDMENEWKERYEVIKKEAMSLAQGKSVVGGPYKFSRYSQPGRIDYKKVPQLDGVDLNPYRKSAIECWRLI